jgi:hypothetical protein
MVLPFLLISKKIKTTATRRMDLYLHQNVIIGDSALNHLVELNCFAEKSTLSAIFSKLDVFPPALLSKLLNLTKKTDHPFEYNISSTIVIVYFGSRKCFCWLQCLRK